MYTDLLNFLRNEECFIEAEAKPTRMRNFIDNYNAKYRESLLITDDGIILLQADANKWGPLVCMSPLRNLPAPAQRYPLQDLAIVWPKAFVKP